MKYTGKPEIGLSHKQHVKIDDVVRGGVREADNVNEKEHDDDDKGKGLARLPVWRGDLQC